VSAAIAIFLIVGATIASFAIPPHRLFRRKRDPPDPQPPSPKSVVQ
jgi:hypothetical protein